MDRSKIISTTQVATELGVERRTVADLARMLGIKAGRHPSNARSRSYSIADVELMRKAIDRVREMAPLSA